MYFNVIASGSKGNATLIVNKDSLILVDMGIALTRLNEGLEEIGKTLEDIDGVVFTHDHSDHISGAKFFAQNKMYALKGTLPGTNINVVELNKPFQIKSFSITPFRISHDATNPCGYLISDGEERLVYITDTGYVIQETIPLIKNPNYLILESNHDIKMLLNTNRPMELKQRILSEYGHLCNEDSALAAAMIIGPDTSEVILAHLSEEANTSAIAIKAYKQIFNYLHIDTSKIRLAAAKQYKSLKGGRHEN